jgi:hypothetical protein
MDANTIITVQVSRTHISYIDYMAYAYYCICICVQILKTFKVYHLTSLPR